MPDVMKKLRDILSCDTVLGKVCRRWKKFSFNNLLEIRSDFSSSGTCFENTASVASSGLRYQECRSIILSRTFRRSLSSYDLRRWIGWISLTGASGALLDVNHDWMYTLTTNLLKRWILCIWRPVKFSTVSLPSYSSSIFMDKWSLTSNLLCVEHMAFWLLHWCLDQQLVQPEQGIPCNPLLYGYHQAVQLWSLSDSLKLLSSVFLQIFHINYLLMCKTVPAFFEFLEKKNFSSWRWSHADLECVS